MIDLARYLEAVRAAATRLGPHRAPVLGAVALGFPALEAVVRGARLVDHVAAPGQRRQPIDAPVFVVGHARSGTTLLHRLLATDPRFTTPTAWQLVLPAVSLYSGVAAATRADRQGRLAAVAHVAELALFAAMRERHETGWGKPEEDSWLFVHTAATPFLELLTGDPRSLAPLWIQDDLPRRESDRRMRWYRRSLQRHLYAVGGGTLLSKNPIFTGWLRRLNEAFPDARFVMLVRDPAEAIASRLGMLVATWRLSEPDLKPGDPRIRAAFALSCAVYRHAEAVWPELPPARAVRVPYSGLVADPLATLSGIYHHFGWSLPPETAAAAAAIPPRLPVRGPLLRQFGLRESDLAAALGDVAPLWASLGRRPPRGAPRVDADR